MANRLHAPDTPLNATVSGRRRPLHGGRAGSPPDLTYDASPSLGFQVKYYAIAELEITDSTWVESYVPAVTKLVEELGGRYLARTSTIEKLEGTRPAPQVFLMIEWPSREAAMEFYESEAYRPYHERRRAGARNELLLVAGEDMTGAAHVAE